MQKISTVLNFTSSTIGILNVSDRSRDTRLNETDELLHILLRSDVTNIHNNLLLSLNSGFPPHASTFPHNDANDTSTGGGGLLSFSPELLTSKETNIAPPLPPPSQWFLDLQQLPNSEPSTASNPFVRNLFSNTPSKSQSQEEGVMAAANTLTLLDPFSVSGGDSFGLDTSSSSAAAAAVSEAPATTSIIDPTTNCAITGAATAAIEDSSSYSSMASTVPAIPVIRSLSADRCNSGAASSSSSLSARLQTTISESLVVVERGNQLEKVELQGTLYADIAHSDTDANSDGLIDAPNRMINADIIVDDRQLLLKSLILSKSISQAPTQLQAGPVFAAGQPTQEIKNVSLCIGQKAVAGAAATAVATRLGTPVLRYTCVDQFRPILFKARNQLSMSPVVDVDGARDDLPPGTGITGIRSRHQIKLTAQIVFNPKFPFPLSDFTVQVSLTALQLKWSADSKPVDDVLIESVAASGTGASLHTYSSKSRVFTWNCGLVVPSAAGGGKGRLTLETTVVVSSPQPQGESEAGIALLSPSLPMIIRCGYEGQLISNRMISIAVHPSDPPSRSTRAPGEEKLQTKIEFKFY